MKRKRLRTSVILFTLVLVLSPLVLLGIHLVRSAQPLDNRDVIGDWVSEDGVGTIEFREDGSAELDGVVYPTLPEEAQDPGIGRVGHARGSWYIGGSMSNQVTVLIDDDVGIMHFFAERPIIGDLRLVSIASIDETGDEQSFTKQ